MPRSRLLARSSNHHTMRTARATIHEPSPQLRPTVPRTRAGATLSRNGSSLGTHVVSRDTPAPPTPINALPRSCRSARSPRPPRSPSHTIIIVVSENACMYVTVVIIDIPDDRETRKRARDSDAEGSRPVRAVPSQAINATRGDHD
ncbi:hypothetical protein EIP86_001115 [Pleurotus ostreatoroseus]|nr:hypothetical protein EIP86_001115 [Pleurotus ostreatoroseus]